MKPEITRLTDRPAPERKLDDAVLPLAIRSKTGLAERKAGDVDTEEVTARSTDGLFTFVVTVLK